MTRLSKTFIGILSALFAIVVVTIIMLVVAQDFFIFPELWHSKVRHDKNLTAELPLGFSTETLQTRDNEKLELAKYSPVSNPKVVSILFHGGSENLRDTTQIQSWLGNLGTNSLQVDYRGFGNSTGWPSETGIFIDAETLWEHAVTREHATAQNTVLVGVGLGSAPATYLASRIKPALLILISPITSFSDVARDNPYYQFLAPFLKEKFLTEQFLTALTGSSVVILHGAKDSVTPVKYSRKLAADLVNYRFARYLEDPGAGHDDIFQRNQEKLALEPALRRLLEHQINESIK